MLAKIRNLKHQKQPCFLSCVPTCLAIAVDIPVKDILENMDDKFESPMPACEMTHLFLNFDVYLESVYSSIGSFIFEKGCIYMGNCISKTGSGLHAILFYLTDEDDVVCFDPNEDKEREFYNIDSFMLYTKVISIYKLHSVKKSKKIQEYLNEN